MTLLRFTIYFAGGLLLVIAWICWSVSGSAMATSTMALILVPAFGTLLLYGGDRFIHAAWFGHRVAFRLRDYRPCGTCPFTKGKAVIPRLFVTEMHALGPVSVTIRHELPILISEAAAQTYKNEELTVIAGIRAARFTNRKAVIYIKDRDYHQAFIAQNERAIL